MTVCGSITNACIVRPVKALWRRRPVRHVIFGLVPLLVTGPVVIILLAVRLADESGPVRAATASATGAVQRSGFETTVSELEIAWTDDAGTRHTSTVHTARPNNVPVGSQVAVRYKPGDPGQIFVTGDDVTSRLTDLGFGILLAALLAAGVVAAGAVHIARRLAAERRPATSLPVSYARSRFGLNRRSWLLVEEAGQTWWVSVHWDPVLETLGPGEPQRCTAGRPGTGWSPSTSTAPGSGRPAGAGSPPPRGEIDRQGVEPGEHRPGRGHRRAADEQFRADTGLVIAAPILGILWAYVDDGGKASFLLATVLSGAALFWVPTVRGSDPT